jgi:cytoskeleton protein RodZ
MAVTGKDVGACLRDARERLGLSLRQIATSTRISVQALDALERNDIARLPGGIFTRAFVRSYAHEVGLDPEETVRDFVEQFPVEAVTYGSPLVELPPADSDRTLDPELKPWPNLVFIGTAVAVGVVGLTLAVLWARGALTASASSESPVPSSSPPTPSAVSSNVPTAAPVLQPIPSPPASVVDDGLRVSVTSESPCWVRIVADDAVRYEGLLQQGVAQTREARRSLEVRVGDAAACRVTLNGRPTRALGTSGQVVTLRVTPESVERYLAK